MKYVYMKHRILPRFSEGIEVFTQIFESEQVKEKKKAESSLSD